MRTRILTLLMVIFFFGCSQTHQPSISYRGNCLRNKYNNIIYWRRYPIIIRIDSNLSDYQIDSTMAAVDRWNRVANAQIFSYNMIQENSDSSSERIDSSVWIGECQLGRNSEEQQLLGFTNRTFLLDSYGEPIRINLGSICIWNHLSDDQWYPVVLHELGHIVGLNHDMQENSIMYPDPVSSTGNILNEDREYVRIIGNTITRRQRN